MTKHISRLVLAFSLLGFSLSTIAQNIERVDPPFWWIGMQNDTLELLIKGTYLSDDVTIKSENVILLSVELNDNAHYLFVQLYISKTAEPQNLKIYSGKKHVNYELKARSDQNKSLMGLDPSDLVYLITPDRFANGNEKNDVVKGMNEIEVNRFEPYGRHGGDIAGIRSKIDYLYETEYIKDTSVSGWLVFVGPSVVEQINGLIEIDVETSEKRLLLAKCLTIRDDISLDVIEKISNDISLDKFN